MTRSHSPAIPLPASARIWVLTVLATLIAMSVTPPAAAQATDGLTLEERIQRRPAAATTTDSASAIESINPVRMLAESGSLLQAVGGNAGAVGALIDGSSPDVSTATDVDAGAGADIPEGGFSATISIVLLLTVLSIAPSIVILCTSFTRIIIVLALLRQAMGTQALPPGQVVTGLALFMTFMVMTPTLERMHAEALVPLQNNEINHLQAWERAKAPLREFMIAQIDHADGWDEVDMLLTYRGVDTSDRAAMRVDDIDMVTLVPAFVLSELKVAFLMGFKLYLPFLVIDMVVASVLISMGMMMLPPVFISLPFKLLMFVLVDGWVLITGNLLNSFAIPGVTIPGVGS